MFTYQKKSNLQRNTAENICESITYEDDLVEFSWCYTKYFTRSRIFIQKFSLFKFNLL